jgi:pyrimidine-nucleoside phosphorylase
MKTVAVLTAMEQPLGRYVGNALEVRQAVEILGGDESAADYREVTLTLGGWMLSLAKLARTPAEGAAKMAEAIKDRRGLAALRAVIKAQGGEPSVVDDPGLLPKAKLSREYAAPKDGYITRMDARMVGQAAVLLGAGRAYMEQELDYGAGFELKRKVGDPVKKGQLIAVLHANDAGRLGQGERMFAEAVSIGPKAPRAAKVILEVLK